MARRGFRLGLRLGLLVGAVLLLARVMQSRRSREEPWSPPAPAPSWPPLQPEPVTVEPPAPPVAEPAAPVKKAPAKRAAAPRPAGTRPPAKKAPAKKAAPRARHPWVEPAGTECPPTHPVKAKLSSLLYHLPGMAAYNRTRPDRCYLDAAAAEADGFIRAKR